MSKTIGTSLRLTIRGVPYGHSLDGSVAFGKSAGAPATFAGLANPVVYPLSDPATWDSLSTTDTGTDLTFALARGPNVNANAAWTAGDHVWFAVFDSLAPSAGDVPLATFGPVPVLA